MVNQIGFPQDTPADCFNAACNVLERHHQTVRDLFPGREIRVPHIPFSSFIVIRIEIYFDAATLICSFDKAGICNGSHLHLNNPEDLIHFIEHCNRVFVLDSGLMLWKTESCSIHMVSDEEGASFYFLPETTQSKTAAMMEKII